MSYTTQKLLTSASLRSFAPTDQATLTPTDILLLADEETANSIVPSLMKAREEFFVTYKDYPIVQGQAAYDIPVRAIGMAAREVKLLDSSGSLVDLDQVDYESLETTNLGSPRAFYIGDNQLFLTPTPDTTSGTLRVWYSKRPSDLVETTAAGLITAIDTGTNTVTASSLPSTWATGMAFDLIRQDGGQECVAIDLLAANVSGTSVTLSSLPVKLRVGDWIALAGESPLVQLPPDYRPVLSQAVTTRILMSMRLVGAQEEAGRLAKMFADVESLIQPRVIGAPKKIISRTWS